MMVVVDNVLVCFETSVCQLQVLATDLVGIARCCLGRPRRQNYVLQQVLVQLQLFATRAFQLRNFAPPNIICDFLKLIQVLQEHRLLSVTCQTPASNKNI
jgi:hypothetical protein